MAENWMKRVSGAHVFIQYVSIYKLCSHTKRHFQMKNSILIQLLRICVFGEAVLTLHHHSPLTLALMLSMHSTSNTQSTVLCRPIFIESIWACPINLMEFRSLPMLQRWIQVIWKLLRKCATTQWNGRMSE